MARLYTDTPFSGTFGNLTVYSVGDRCYARTKSSLDKKRFYKDPAFARSRERATQFGMAAQLVKVFYKTLSPEVKRHGLFGKLTALAYKGLQAGTCEVEVIQELQQFCGIEQSIEQPRPNEKVVINAIKPLQGQYHIDDKENLLSKWQVNTNGVLEDVKQNETTVIMLRQEFTIDLPAELLPDG